MSKTETDRQLEEPLDLIPRAVRDKLDRVGIKLHLKEWQTLSLADRQRLRDLPCSDDAAAEKYTHCIDAMVVAALGRPAERLSQK